MRLEISEMHNRLGTTMIYVTHDQVEAMTLADRIAVMRGGLIMQLGTPDQIYNRPLNKYVADFIGSPSMNFLEGELKDGQLHIGEHVLPTNGYEFVEGKSTDGPVWAGIRPEHVVTGELADKAAYSTEIEVEIVEPMGSDTLIWTKFAGKELRFRMDGTARVAIGEKLRIGFKVAATSLFDMTSEERI